MEHPGFNFIASIEYEQFPPFYSFFKMIDHELFSCKSCKHEHNKKINNQAMVCAKSFSK